MSKKTNRLNLHATHTHTHIFIHIKQKKEHFCLPFLLKSFSHCASGYTVFCKIMFIASRAQSTYMAFANPDFLILFNLNY